MKVTDFAAMREIADEYGLLIIADNTFLDTIFSETADSGGRSGCPQRYKISGRT